MDASGDLIGNTTDNLFSVCGSDDVITAFNEILVVGGSAEGDIEDAFEECVNNAAASNPQPVGVAQAQISTLQENSLTANVKPEAEIPSLNTELQNSDLNALLEHPNVKALLENPDLNALLENPDDPKALLENPDVKALLEDSEVNALLEDSKW